MPKVHLPDGRIVNFPDSMSPEQITAAIEEVSAPKQETAPQPEGKSVGGFLGNVVSSGANFVKDTVTGIPALAKAAVSSIDPRPQARTEQGGRIMATLKAIPQMAGERYGSLEKAGNTLYNDPVGALADVSMLTGIGAPVAGTRAPRIAARLRQVEQSTNPLRAAGPAAKAVEYGTAAAIRPMLAPGKSTIRQSRAPLEVERTALTTGAATEGGARAKLRIAADKTTKAADEATGAGVTVPRDRVTQFPKTLQKTEELTPNVRELDDLAALETETVASLPEHLTPSELLTRRRALDKASDTAYRAEERGGYIRSTRDKGQKELGGNFREALREVAPGVRASDDEARRLGLVVQALENANTRPKGIPMSAALGAAGGGFFSGVPAAAVLGGALGVGRTFPQIPLALGSVPVRGTAAVASATANPTVRQGTLLAALLERLNAEQ